MKKSTSWLAYSKTILEKVSFDQKIFRKELRKSLSKLTREEIRKLEAWCINNFGLLYSTIAVREIGAYLSMQS